MCGFLYVPGYRHLGPSEQAWCRQAASKMGHRGTRTSVEVFEGDLYVHRRLPIVDLTEAGDHLRRGPFMFVGEIFNYQDLEPDKRWDLDVMVKRFVAEGTDAFHEFDGFWAAVLDGNVINDYLGQKPIYYRTKPFTCFASEPAMLSMGKLNDKHLATVVMHGVDFSGDTAFDGVFLMPPGHVWTKRTRAFRRYWDWNLVPTPVDLGIAIVLATGRRANHGDLRPVLLASGGLDSTILACLRDFNLVHVNNPGDEEFFWRVPGTDRLFVDLSAVTPQDAMRANQSAVDLGSVIPQFALSTALKGTHVVLSGDGADELFGGYSRANVFDSMPYDVFVELPYYHLPRLDALMMANTIELRSPFLAPDVVKLATELPSKDRVGKRILKEIFQTVVPKEILERKKVPLRVDAFSNNLPERMERVRLFREIFS